MIFYKNIHNFEIIYYKFTPLAIIKNLAKFISTIGNPMSLGLFYGIYLTFHVGGQINYLPAIFAAFIVIPIFIFTAIKVKNKEFTDYDVSNRVSRNKLYNFILLLFLILTFYLIWFQYDFKSYLLTSTFFLLILISSRINRIVKISMHTSFAFLFSILFYVLNTKIAILLMFFAFCIGWSRLELNRHKKIEVVYGGLLGTLIGILYLAFFYKFN